ncbi:MAG: thioredoxin family protein [Elusimicrobiota bacterium]|jgi:thioredoxin 1|nr:thioredoxin family protein [Elusimicrobiota bacterium]
MNDKIISDADFHEAETCKGPHFIEFFATWCPHCQRMAPIIENLAKEYKGRVEFFLVDVDQAPEACDKYEVSGTPTMFLYKKNSGAKHADKLVGEQDPDDLREYLNKIL